MEQQIRLCILGDPAADTTDLRSLLFGRSDAPEPELYPDHDAFCAAVVSAAQAEGGTVIAAAAPANYTAAKLRLIKAFGSKAVKSKPILAALEGSGLEGRAADLESAVPVGAAVFPGPQGKYSAFAFRGGNSRVLFLPADAQVLSALPTEEILRELPVKRVPTRAEQLASDVRTVVARGKKIAVADTEAAALLLKVILAAPQADTVFIPTEIKGGKKKKGMDIHAQARAAKEAAQAELGVAVSAPQTDESGATYVTVSVADSDCARAADVFALPEESEQQLATAAVLHVCSMMNTLSAEEGLAPPTDAVPKKKGMHKSLLFAILGIVAALILCGVLIFVMGSRSNAIETGSLRTDAAAAINNAAESGYPEDSMNERGDSGRLDDEEMTHSFFDGISNAIDNRAASMATTTESPSLLAGIATTVIQVAANRSLPTQATTAVKTAGAANRTPAAKTTGAAATTFVINPPLAATVSTTKGAATTAAKATTSTTKPTTSTTRPTTRITASDVDVEKGVTGNTVIPDR
ncbi:MAG: hypothetical protein IKD72_00130, partial [Clostridia bacterium]|nr:hypothetical protein [Clostridia bacterium]